MAGDNSYIDVSVAYSYYRRDKDLYIKNLYTGDQQLSGNPDDADTTMFNAWQFRGTLSRYRNEDTKFKYQLGYDVSLDHASGSKIEQNGRAINNYALFASAKYEPFKQLMIQAGTRVAYNTEYDAPVTPSLNMKYQAGDKLTLRASYGKGFRAPAMKELYLDFKDLNHDIRGNTKLVAERSDNVQASMVFKNEKEYYGFKIEPGFYHNAIENRIGLIERTEVQNIGNQTDTVLYYTYDNFDEYKALGYSLKFHYEHRKIVFFTAGYSNVGVLNHYSDTLQEAADYVFTPEYVLQMRYNFTAAGTQVNVRYKYTGELERQRLNFDNEFVVYREAAYQMMDLSVSQGFFSDKLDIVTGVKNIFDVKNIRATGSSGGVHTSEGTTRSVAWGRSYFIDLTYNF
jgi:outer membrane receptor for ferrienterochelin and colicins